jgi:hypothetical protein
MTETAQGKGRRADKKTCARWGRGGFSDHPDLLDENSGKVL